MDADAVDDWQVCDQSFCSDGSAPPRSPLYVCVSRSSLTVELYSLFRQPLCAEVTSLPISTNTNHSNYMFGQSGVKGAQADIYGSTVETEFNVQWSVVEINLQRITNWICNTALLLFIFSLLLSCTAKYYICVQIAFVKCFQNLDVDLLLFLS